MLKVHLKKINSFIKLTRIPKKFGIGSDVLRALITINISKLYKAKVDEKLIILGGSSGKAFIGNTKHLYYYLKKNTDYKLIYFTKNSELRKNLKKMGINAVKPHSIKAIKLLRRARFVFVTHGLSDVVPIRFSKNTTFVETWHGILNKRYRRLYDHYEYSTWAKIFKLKIENDQIYDYFLTPSGTAENLKVITDHFQIPAERILAYGYPRNDVFFNNDPAFYKNIKKKYKFPDNKRIILYAPTFRDKDYTAKFPLNENEFSELNQLLKDADTILLMKAHVSERTVEFNSFSQFVKIPKDSDIQELLYISDILITDYSSVYCDYLLLNRPILFFTYDYEYYRTQNRGLLYNLKVMAPGPLIYTGKELIKTIKNISQIDKEYESKRKRLNNYFNKHKDGKSTERLLKHLKIIT